MRESLIQCLLFVVNGKTSCSYVLIPSAAVELSNVCELFVRNNVQILNNGADCSPLCADLERYQVEVLELVVLSNTSNRVFSCASETTPFVPVSVKACNQEFVRRLLGKDAAVFGMRNIDRYADFQAIADRDLDILKQIVTLQPNIRYKNQDGETFLHLAVRLQNDALVELLLNHGVNINTVNKDGSTALHLAVEADAVSNVNYNGGDNLYTIANLLLEGGTTVNARRKDGSTSLLLALKKRAYCMIRLLLRYDADVNIGDHTGLTPLHSAVNMENLEIVDDFLRRNANVNAIAATCYPLNLVTPLWVAVEAGSLALVKRLLAKGADLSTPCDVNQTILKLAVDLKRINIIECILKHHPKLSSIYSGEIICKSAFQNDMAFNEISKLLTSHGFKVSVSGNREMLQDVLNQGDEITAKGLLEAGLKVNQVSIWNDTNATDSEYSVTCQKTLPLYIAIDKNMPDIVKLMISQGADIHAKLNVNDEVCPVLSYAVEKSLWDNDEISLAILSEYEKIPPDVANDLVKKAIERESSLFLGKLFEKLSRPYFEIESNSNPFILCAVERFDLGLVEILLKNGASIEARHSYDGDTVLHSIESEAENHPKVLRCLIQNAADLEARNFHGDTPLATAISMDKLEFVRALLKYGPRIDVYNDSGAKPIQQAISLSSPPIFEALLQFHFNDSTLVQRTDIYKVFNRGYIESLRDSEGWLKRLYNLFIDEDEDLMNCAEVLARHMIRLKAAFSEREIFDFCSKINLESLSKNEYLMPEDRTEEDWLTFKSQCETEMEQLKSQNIGDSCAFYYDLLTKTQDEVASYLQNSVILQALESKFYETEFPVYAEILSYQFKKGSLRRELLNEGAKQCHLLAGVFKDLPVHLKEKVLSYLSNRELEVAVHACRCIKRQ